MIEDLVVFSNSLKVNKTTWNSTGMDGQLLGEIANITPPEGRNSLSFFDQW